MTHPATRLRLLMLLATIVGANSVTVAQRPSFSDLERRIERESSLPAGKRRAAIDQIGSFNSAAARRFLLELLGREQSGGLATRIIGLLRRYDHASIVPAMRKTLARAPRQVHAVVARGLRGRGDDGIRVLVAALEREPRDWAKQHLIVNLRACAGNARASRALIEVFPTVAVEQQIGILRALEDAPKSKDLTRLLVGCDQSPDTRVAMLALAGLARQRHPSVKSTAMLQTWDLPGTRRAKMLGTLCFCLLTVIDAETLPAALDLFGDVDEVRTELLGLNRMPERFVASIVETLRELSAGYDAEDRVKVTGVLGLLAHPDAAAGVRLALTDPDERVVSAALRCLEDRPVAAEDELSDLLQSSNVEHVTASLLALHESSKQDRDWAERLMQHADAAEPAVRLVVMGLLTELSHRPALPLAQARFTAPTWPERSAAYAFCRAVRDPSSVPLLIARLSEEDGRLHAEVHDTLKALTAKSLPGKRIYWEQWWQVAGDEFELPPAADIDPDAVAEPGVLTYHGVPLHSKRACFLVDVSGSMKAGGTGTDRTTRIEAAKKALRSVVEQCAEDVRFNIIRFSGSAKPWEQSLCEATPANRAAARRFVDRLTAAGGTNVYDALRTAFEDPEVDTIFLLSDGDPSGGKIHDPIRLAREVRRWNRDRCVVIHTIAIGQDREFMKTLARESGGRYVRRL